MFATFASAAAVRGFVTYARNWDYHTVIENLAVRSHNAVGEKDKLKDKQYYYSQCKPTKNSDHIHGMSAFAAIESLSPKNIA